MCQALVASWSKSKLHHVPACTYMAQAGCVKGGLDFICGAIPRRDAARKTLDCVPIRFFVLKIVFQILMDLRGVRDQAATA